MSNDPKNALVQLAGVVGGCVIVVVAVLALFARDRIVVAAYVAGVLAFMAIVLGYLASRSKPPGPGEQK